MLVTTLANIFDVIPKRHEVYRSAIYANDSCKPCGMTPPKVYDENWLQYSSHARNLPTGVSSSPDYRKSGI